MDNPDFANSSELKNISCCFTGHRNILPADEPKLKSELTAQIEKMILHGVIYFYCGGAVGFDTLAAACILEIRKRMPDIKLIMTLPCHDQDKFYNAYQRRLFEHIKRCADKVIYTYDGKYLAGCMHIRNRYMVDRSAYCICYMRKYEGGTKYTTDYALKCGLNVIYV